MSAPERKRRTRSSVSTTGLSLLVAALLFASPSTTNLQHSNKNENESTIRYWAAEAMSPSAELTAAAAAAVVRRNVISGAAIFTVGDAAAQMLTAKQKKTTPLAIATAKGTNLETEENSTIEQSTKTKSIAFPSLDMNRLYSSLVLGAIWSGFCVPFIYGTVEKTFPGKANLRQVLIKVLVTCSILSTIGNWVTMFARRFAAQYMTYQFDKSSSLRLKWFSKPVESMLLFSAIFKGCWKSCNRDIMEVILDDIKIWPLYDLTCYSVIPPTWRPITTSIMSSAWAMYMSVVSAKEDEEEEEAPIASASPVPPVSTIEPPVQPIKAIVKPLDPPFPNKVVVSSETTKRLIGVKGGEAPKNVFGVSPYKSSDGDDDDVAQSA